MLGVKICKNNNNNDWLVNQFEIFSNGSFVAEKFIPRPDISIIFHFKGRPLILGETNVELEPFFVAPIIPKFIEMTSQGIMDTFIVNCKPTVFSRVFALDLTPNPKYSIDLPDQAFLSLWNELSKLKTSEERINRFSNFINSYQKTTYQPDEIDLFYDKIIEKGITTMLKDIVKEFSLSQRTLERNFIKRTGVTPKTLVRVLRLDYLWTKINDENVIDYQDLVFQGNYFDQAHFIRDFKSIIGETPNYFFDRNLQITKMFSGREQGKIK